MYGNGIDIAATQRIAGEWYSLKHVPVAPCLKGASHDSIMMSYVDGERSLDDAIGSYAEYRQDAVFHVAGKTLAGIHSINQSQAYNYDQAHFSKVAKLFRTVTPILSHYGISSSLLTQFLIESYNSREIQKQGLVWTHGDYWLNNIIGVPQNGGFHLNGVIDWELAKPGSPYEDFAIVEMSIEDPYPQASSPYWQAYGGFPDIALKRHFSIVKTLEWMTADNNFETEFYQKKFEMMRQSIQ